MFLIAFKILPIFCFCNLYANLNLEQFFRFQNTFTSNFDDSVHLEILKEGLLRAVHDIDAKFSEVNSTFCSFATL